MTHDKIIDVAIIGSGPSGIFTALQLVEAGLAVTIIDKGGNFYTRANREERDLIGFGGAAMRYDANLDYSDGIPEKSQLGERVFGRRDVAVRYIKAVYKKLELFGLEKDEVKKSTRLNENSRSLEIIDRGIVPIGEEASARILKGVYDFLLSKGLEFLEFSEVIGIEKCDGLFEVTISTQGTKEILRAKSVVLATGKLSVSQSRNIFEKLGVHYQKCNAIDIGIRVETKKEATDRITLGCINPKIIVEDGGSVTRTFCWCPGGKVIAYEFEGVHIIDGQHCHDNPTDQTNFGIVTTVELPNTADGTNFGINYIKAFNEFTSQKPGIQILKDFEKGKASLIEDIKTNTVTPTTSSYSSVDLGAILIFDSKRKFLELIRKINEAYPGAIGPDSLVYGPVLERIFPKVVLTENMETSVGGFFLVGDISGKAIGIITGAAMGLKVADHIITKQFPI